MRLGEWVVNHALLYRYILPGRRTKGGLYSEGVLVANGMKRDRAAIISTERKHINIYQKIKTLLSYLSGFGDSVSIRLTNKLNNIHYVHDTVQIQKQK